MLDLPENHLKLVCDILQQYVPEREVWAFGSRVNGKARPYSDLDLVIRGETALTPRTMNQLVEAFQESDLPIRVDVADWASLSPSFQQVILNKYVIVKPGQAAALE